MAKRLIDDLKVATQIDVTGATIVGADTSLNNSSTRIVTNKAVTDRFDELPQPFAGATSYSAGDQICQGGNIYIRITSGTSGAAFDATEQLEWRESDADNELPSDWAALTAYSSNDQVAQGGRVYSRISGGTSRATFDANELQDWRTLNNYLAQISSSTNNAIARWDGTGGTAIQNSGVTIDDSNNLTTTGNLSAAGGTFTGNITASGTVDGRDLAADGTELDGHANLFASGVNYIAGDQIWRRNKLYECVIPHLSTSTFVTANWRTFGAAALLLLNGASDPVSAPETIDANSNDNEAVFYLNTTSNGWFVWDPVDTVWTSVTSYSQSLSGVGGPGSAPSVIRSDADDALVAYYTNTSDSSLYVWNPVTAAWSLIPVASTVLPVFEGNGTPLSAPSGLNSNASDSDPFVYVDKTHNRAYFWDSDSVSWFEATSNIAPEILQGAGAPASAPSVLNAGADDADSFAYVDRTNNIVHFWDSTATAWFTPFGAYSGYGSSGSNAVGLGLNALNGATGDYAVGLGEDALRSNTAANCSAGGYQALLNNTGASASAFGYAALSGNTVANSSAFGYNALLTNTGAHSAAFGYEAGKTSGALGACYFGYQSGLSSSGNYACAFGYASLDATNTGTNNSAFGAFALSANTRGANNFGGGYEAGLYNTIGAGNVFLGKGAGVYHSNGSTHLVSPDNSIYIGHGARGLNNSDSNSIVIGASAISKGANTAVLGTTSTTNNYLYGSLDLASTGNPVLKILADTDANSSATTADILFDRNNGTTVGRIRWDESSATLNFGYGSNNHLRIGSAGNMAINTTPNSRALQVLGSIGVQQLADTVGGGYRVLNAAGTSAVYFWMKSGVARLDNGSTGSSNIIVNSGGTGNFGVGGAATNKLTVTHDESVNTWTSVSDAAKDAGVKILGSSHATPYGIYLGYANSSNNAQGIQAGDGSSALPLALNPTGGNVAIGGLTAPAQLTAWGTAATDGSAPVEIRIADTNNGSWTAGAAFGRLGFYSSDASGVGTTLRGSLDCVMASTTGSTSRLSVMVASTAQLEKIADFTAAGYMTVYERGGSAPGGRAGAGHLFFEDNGAGKLRAMIQFPTGVAQQIAIEP